MRLIDAHYLYEKICEQKRIHEVGAHVGDTDERAVDRYMALAFDDACDIIEESQTIDPVKHGEWVNGNGGQGIWWCSWCMGKAATRIDVMQWNYCPNCGAKMDLS